MLALPGDRNGNRPAWKTSSALLLILASLSIAFGQTSTANLTGLIGDPAGGAIVGPKVRLENAATHEKRDSPRPVRSRVVRHGLQIFHSAEHYFGFRPVRRGERIDADRRSLPARRSRRRTRASGHADGEPGRQVVVSRPFPEGGRGLLPVSPSCPVPDHAKVQNASGNSSPPIFATAIRARRI